MTIDLREGLEKGKDKSRDRKTIPEILPIKESLGLRDKINRDRKKDSLRKTETDLQIKKEILKDLKDNMVETRNKHSLLVFIPSVLLGIFFLQACDTRDYLFEKTFDNQCWSIADSLKFEAELEGSKTFPLLLSFNSDYAYQNIYLKLIYTAPDGKAKELLINEKLSDALGNWQTEIQGSTYFFELPEAINIENPKPGKYSFSLFQYMREDNLCGIEKVGILP